MGYVVEQLGRLLKRCGGKVWLIVEAARYETYLKFSTMFPTVEKDLDLHLMSVTSFRPPMGMGGFSPQNYSLKESFVPFGGFFSSLSDFERPFSSISVYQSVSRCRLCNEKYEQELSAILKGGYFTSVTDQFQETLPSWMQATDISRNKELDVAKAKDGVWNAMHTGLQRKWNEICRRLHCNSPVPVANINRLDSNILGFTSVANDAETHCRNSTNGSPHQAIFPAKLVEFQKIDPPRWNIPLGLVSEGKSENYPSQLRMGTISDEFLQNKGHCSSTCAPQNSRLSDGHASPSSGDSVTTDIGLAVCRSSIRREPNIRETHKDHIQNFPICIPTPIDLNNEEFMDAHAPTLSSSCFEHNLRGEFEPGDFKALWKALAEKVGRQDQAIGVVSRAIIRCRTGSGRHRGASLRGDIWFSFLGPDRVAKKRLALALAELAFGSNQNAICIDLAPQSGTTQSTTILGCQNLNGYNSNSRGKTIIDLIAEEINKNPVSVVFLENVDKADPVARKRLTQAIKTGKFSDSHGRQIGINNVMFVVTSTGIMNGDKKSYSNEPSFEERILAAQCSRLQMVIEHVPRSINRNYASNVLITSRKGAASNIFVEKHDPSFTGDNTGYHSIEQQHNASSFKCLDLNLPMEELEGDTMFDNCEDWLEEFLNQVDESVIFEAFEFNALTDKLLKLISQCFKNAAGHEGHLEIDSKAMEQIVAAVWLSDDEKVADNWVELVLGRGFFDAHQRYRLSATSVLKLVACEGTAIGEQAAGICLPSRIILN
ncbi:hypothetical protein Scep_005656 [Stephania cephalantha]|uniref:ATPase AAA-type core domain-containing protein n=1 Tax=Stephania cephalantha TaxID=152367 RepID=A0AAP0PWK8_9MAGN